MLGAQGTAELEAPRVDRGVVAGKARVTMADVDARRGSREERGERPPSSGLARGHLGLLCKVRTSTGAGE